MRGSKGFERIATPLAAGLRPLCPNGTCFLGSYSLGVSHGQPGLHSWCTERKAWQFDGGTKELMLDVLYPLCLCSQYLSSPPPAAKPSVDINPKASG